MRKLNWLSDSMPPPNAALEIKRFSIIQLLYIGKAAANSAKRECRKPSKPPMESERKTADRGVVQTLRKMQHRSHANTR